MRRAILRITVTCSAGQDLQEAFVEMGSIANRLNIGVEMKGNDCVFWTDPGDTEADIRDAFHRLFYPADKLGSKFIATRVQKPRPIA